MGANGDNVNVCDIDDADASAVVGEYGDDDEIDEVKDDVNNKRRKK